jgi:hypothetical protein
VTELSPDDRALLGEVLKRVRHFEETLGQHYAQGLWTRMDQLYHSYTGLKRTLRDTTGQVREAIWQDARKEFGHELFIPHAYAIVETVLPALLSNRPRILVLPRNEASEQNVENMKATIDAQQSGINLELAAQPVAKSGLHYGIGVGKSYWLRRETEQKKVVKAAWYLQALGQKWALETCSEPLFDDPTFEHIPVRDFGWDVFAANDRPGAARVASDVAGHRVRDGPFERPAGLVARPAHPGGCRDGQRFSGPVSQERAGPVRCAGDSGPGE